jgi:hypothetical protein
MRFVQRGQRRAQVPAMRGQCRNKYWQRNGRQAMSKQPTEIDVAQPPAPRKNKKWPKKIRLTIEANTFREAVARLLNKWPDGAE